MPNHFRRQILVNLAILIGSFIIAIFAVYWLEKDLNVKAETIAKDRLLIKSQTAALADLANLKVILPQATAYKQAMDKTMGTKEQLLDFPRWLEGLARVRRLSVNFNFRGRETEPQGNSPGFINFNLDLGGGIDDLTNFLKDIEYKAPGFLISLDNADLSRTDNNYRIFAQGQVFFR